MLGQTWVIFLTFPNHYLFFVKEFCCFTEKTRNNAMEEFERDLKELLKKWDAEIDLEETYRGYSGSTYTIQATINAIYEDGECLREFKQIDLGTFIDKD